MSVLSYRTLCTCCGVCVCVFGIFVRDNYIISFTISLLLLECVGQKPTAVYVCVPIIVDKRKPCLYKYADTHSKAECGIKQWLRGGVCVQHTIIWNENDKLSCNMFWCYFKALPTIHHHTINLYRYTLKQTEIDYFETAAAAADTPKLPLTAATTTIAQK